MLRTVITTTGGWRRMITYLESSRLWCASRWLFLRVDEIAEQIVVPAVEEVNEPVVEAEEEQVIAPVVDVVEGQMDAPMMDIEEDLAVLFGDDDFEDDASDGLGPSTAVAEEPSFPQVAPRLPVPPCMIEDLREIGPRVLAMEGQMQVMASQMIQAMDRLEQVDVQQRDTQIQQLQTTVTEMSSRESTLMRCNLGLEKWIATLEKRPPGPQ
ncbi:hypothetical protein Tco_1151993 [Tanacetum coccineum]